jgi:membrane-bound lytic murein transglycosylase A
MAFVKRNRRVFTLLALSACVPPTGWRPRIIPADRGDRQALITALSSSVAWLAAQPLTAMQKMGGHDVPVSDSLRALSALLSYLQGEPSDAALTRYVAEHFEPMLASERVLFTGYYEPELEASLTKQPGYEAPIFAKPPDLVELSLGDFSSKLQGERITGRVQGNTFLPYFTREELTKRIDQMPVLAWAKDPVDVFFAEVQGSATLRLPDGSAKRIGFAGKSGRPYRSVGALLIKEQQIRKEEMSMQAIRAWLAAHPLEVPRVLDFNESSVFFRFLDGEPLGALSVPVTAERSIAVDLSVYPRGALAFVTFSDVQSLVLVHDTGGAIKGPNRVDVFFGRGARAAEIAGHLQETGSLWILVPRQE